MTQHPTVEQCGSTLPHDEHDTCAGLSEYDVIVRVGCPDCNAPVGGPCRFSAAPRNGADAWPDTAVHGGRRDLAFTERGTCKLCGLLLLHDQRTDRVWHPMSITERCPPMPDPGTDWNAYALAVQSGTVPGEPGRDQFIPETEQPAPLILCPECRASKHGNCDGQAWDQAADAPAPCECPEH